MNQKSKQGPFHKRAIIFLAGLLITAMLISVYGIGLWLFISSLPSKWSGFTGWLAENPKEFVAFLRGQEKEMIGLWIIGFMFSIWLISSPLICLYWLFKPAERFWWKHKYISHAIVFGSFLGSVVIVTAGIHFLLWFFPDGKIGFQARVYIAVAIGIIATLVFFYRLYSDLERRLEEARADRFRREVSNKKRDLEEGNTTLVEVTRTINEMLQRADKLSPVENIQLNALEQVWYEEKDLRENIRRIRKLHNLMIKDKLGVFGRKRLFDLAAEFEDSYGLPATKSLLDSTFPEQKLLEELEEWDEEEDSVS